VVEQTGAQVIPIDGKSMKRLLRPSQKQSALHIVSAWAVHRLMLGLVLVENKTNEIKAIKSVTGITGDYGVHHHYRCHGHQTEIARQIGQRRRLRFVSQSKPSQLMRTGESCEFRILCPLLFQKLCPLLAPVSWLAIVNRMVVKVNEHAIKPTGNQ